MKNFLMAIWQWVLGNPKIPRLSRPIRKETLYEKIVLPEWKRLQRTPAHTIRPFYLNHCHLDKRGKPIPYRRKGWDGINCPCGSFKPYKNCCLNP